MKITEYLSQSHLLFERTRFNGLFKTPSCPLYSNGISVSQKYSIELIVKSIQKFIASDTLIFDNSKLFSWHQASK